MPRPCPHRKLERAQAARRDAPLHRDAPRHHRHAWVGRAPAGSGSGRHVAEGGLSAARAARRAALLRRRQPLFRAGAWRRRSSDRASGRCSAPPSRAPRAPCRRRRRRRPLLAVFPSVWCVVRACAHAQRTAASPPLPSVTRAPRAARPRPHPRPASKHPLPGVSVGSGLISPAPAGQGGG